MKIYFYRHQAQGIMWEHPFSSRPTDEQLAPIRHLMMVRHGLDHPKLKKPWWDKLVEVDVLAEGQVPQIEDPGVSSVSDNVGTGALANLEASGRGHVENPK